MVGNGKIVDSKNKSEPSAAFICLYAVFSREAFQATNLGENKKLERYFGMKKYFRKDNYRM